ncbi:MAG: hypothetical protein FJ044_03250 [Candidatus Cloacimonetes bacterium]|nr:hypothetical protein [Candidatus Cloacimonadota bacterium]
MFKKKEFLVIFIVSLLATWGTGFIARPGCGNFPDALCESGWPLVFHRVGGFMGINEWYWGNLVLDFAVCFLVLMIGWWVAKKIILWYKKDNEKS